MDDQPSRLGDHGRYPAQTMTISDLNALKDHASELVGSFTDQTTAEAVAGWETPYLELNLPSAAWLVFDVDHIIEAEMVTVFI